MNEAETRAELIDPKLKACGWGVAEGSEILPEHYVCIYKKRHKLKFSRLKNLAADFNSYQSII